ncbi:MAG: hypothetical protein OER92_12140, partial [Alphaproteobacteria bacterium]|nr:hypothetical protein [Alphaproteobacteria bacterium]
MDPVARWFWSHWLHNCEKAPVIERDGEYLSFPYGMFGSGYEVSEDQVTKLNKLVGTINQFTFWLLFVAIPVGVYLAAFLSGLSNNSIIILLISVVYALTLAFLIYYDSGSHKILKNANMSTYRMTLDDHFSLINRDAPSYL